MIKMGSQVIKKELREVTERMGITQTTLSKRTFRAKTTTNGYFRGDPAPVEAMADMASYIDDSLFNQDMAHKVFNVIPSMQSDVYQQHPHALDVIHKLETEERRARKNRAMLILTKNSNMISESEKEEIVDYALNFLDEVFIETRCIVSILDKVNLSLMSAVKQRVPHWKAQNYMRGE